MYQNNFEEEDSINSYQLNDDASTTEDLEEDDLEVIYRTKEDLMSSKTDFKDIGLHQESLFGKNFLAGDIFDEKLEEVQTALFQSPTFLEGRKAEAKKIQSERELKLRQQKILEEEIRLKEAETRASAFQFDFGYLDAEVHDLLAQLESVYPDVGPLPNTSSTKSIYHITKANVEKLGLKIILNRVCIIGKYKISGSKPSKTDLEDDENTKSMQSEDVQKTFIEELKRIRARTDSVFASELGEITGCLLSYPNNFIVMFEGPELSIMDVLHQGKSLFGNYAKDGSVLFVASHVMVRYLQSWTDLIMTPPPPTDNIKKGGNVEAAKENLVILSESCQRLWRVVAKAQRNGLNPSDYIVYDMLPDDRIIQFSMDCGLLRALHVWLRRVTQLTFGDFTSETWPQVFYPSVANAHKNDTQFDSLGVLENYEDMPGVDQVLEEFLNTKISWKPKENLSEDNEGVTKTLKDKLLKKGSIVSVFSAVSKDTAYQ